MCYPCKYCGQCGAKLPPKATLCPKCRIELTPENPVCPQCGWKLPSPPGQNVKKSGAE